MLLFHRLEGKNSQSMNDHLGYMICRSLLLSLCTMASRVQNVRIMLDHCS